MLIKFALSQVIGDMFIIVDIVLNEKVVLFEKKKPDC